TYLPAFKALVQEAGVESVMGAYNRVNGEPCCGSGTLLKKILREEWGFEGHILSDCWAIRDFHTGHGVTVTAPESAALAINNGCDLNCGNTYLHILKAYEKGLVTEETITRAAERLFTTRYLLGIMDGCEFDSIPYEKVCCEEHLAVAERMSEECPVLLKNDGILPLDPHKRQTIGVIGPNADSRVALVGNYHGTSPEYITVLEGIRRLVSDKTRILYSQGCHLYKDRVEDLAWPQDRLSEAVITAKHSDVVILCLGLDETLEGEEGDTGNSYASGDKVDLRYPKVQEELLNAVLSAGKPVILVSMTGSAMDLRTAAGEGGAAAILQTWYPGARGGLAVAKILFGEVSPSGKLPVTFYQNSESLPDFTDYSMAGRTYRYLAEEPLYPFGFGLTYGKVCLTALEAEKLPKVPEEFTVHVRLRNVGSSSVTEVVQLYIKNLDSPLAVKNHSLCGFQRVTLEPGWEKAVSFRIPKEALLQIDEEGRAVADGKKFILYAGISQPDSRSFALTGEKPLELSFELE
ncbi:MAG: glycoside hydrolase family 3 C-terminal domain-containing protein, partial [Blautia sp.]|nr:glycoside hydrolase family 3 C-terminal domain-containing protein [Blautia sp.]